MAGRAARYQRGGPTSFSWSPPTAPSHTLFPPTPTEFNQRFHSPNVDSISPVIHRGSRSSVRAHNTQIGLNAEAM